MQGGLIRNWITGTATVGFVLYGATSNAQTLTDAVAQAIAKHPEVQTARANWHAAAATVPQARSLFLPSLDATLGRSHELTENLGTRFLSSPQSLDRTKAQLNLTQLLFDGGIAWSQVKREQARADAAYAQLATTAENIAFRTAQAFFEVLRLRALIALAEQNAAAHRRTLEQTMRRTAVGVGRRSDNWQTEARLALAQSSLIQLRGQLEQAEAAYRNLAGRPAGLLLRGETPLAVVPVSAQAAVDSALAHHPAVRSAQLELKAAEADREFARSRYWPRVTLELSASQNRDLYGVLGTNSDRTAMLMLRHNLFRGGADAARIRETEARRDEAAARLVRVQNDLEHDVRQAWEGLASDRARLPEIQRYADISVEVVKDYLIQFNVAQRSLLDVLNAENEAFNARGSQITADYAVSAGVYRLLSGMGRGLEQLDVKLAPNTPREDGKGAKPR